MAALCLQTRVQAQSVSVRMILDKMYAAFGSAKHYAYQMYSKERFGDKYFERDMYFKIHDSPRKIYGKDEKDGVELLYVKGWNDDKVFINPNGFPWTNVSFSIYNSRVREDNHHLLTTAGFAFTGKLLKETEAKIVKGGRKIEEFFTYTGDVKFEGHDCYKLNMEHKDFKFIDYKVPADIELEKLCLDLGIPEYLTKERNNLPYGKVRAGTVLQIPSSYAKQVVFYVDKKLFLPRVQLLYDDKGLYEKYEYRNIKVNFTPAPNEWTPECEAYGF